MNLSPQSMLCNFCSWNSIVQESRRRWQNQSHSLHHASFSCTVFKSLGEGDKISHIHYIMQVFHVNRSSRNSYHFQTTIWEPPPPLYYDTCTNLPVSKASHPISTYFSYRRKTNLSSHCIIKMERHRNVSKCPTKRLCPWNRCVISRLFLWNKLVWKRGADLEIGI